MFSLLLPLYYRNWPQYRDLSKHPQAYLVKPKFLEISNIKVCIEIKYCKPLLWDNKPNPKIFRRFRGALRTL